MRNKKKSIVLQDVLVEDYAAEGKSLARVDGKVVFIEKAVPGDVVDIQLSKNKKDWAEGHAIRIKKYSADRVEPFCEHFGICGGCQWQMLPYQKQLHYKHKQVTDNLQRIGKLPLPEIQPIAGCEETRYYRNKLEYTFSTKRFIPQSEFEALKKIQAESGQGFEFTEKTGVAGFHAKGMFDKLVEINTCHLQHEPTNLIRNAIAAYARQKKWSFYDIRQHEGWLRTMQVRLATTGELMVNIVFGFENADNRKELLDYLLREFPQITTLLYTINTKKNDSLYDQEPIVYHGKGYIIETLEDFRFKISPKSFFQTNSRQAEELYRITRDFAELNGSQTVYDLYCGTGSIGIFVSKLAKQIIGVEVVAEAIEDAKENAELNGLQHASFYAGDVIDICDDAFFAKHGRPDVIITDPPRAGMHEKLVQKLLEIAAPVVVYVSCNPATQARDLNLLGEKYTVEKIQPVDMFPHTLHIENVVQLKLKA
ncbi:23S rRNA (uracil1939-C5)-methyltransferase [Filimonas lacunae]|uniref:23S rRNA (Uracil1939-C5)-methyltransferase n=1 Tax=Filimonas lacunae TaxID=477680 RepID=A0A173MQ01_9BACT|nr:23S rRNA (uracil(1939)-C(5))-methyltransferase RlmD [Filimonas lacunae]BAV09576.1 RNA methyltransferase, TrmA family [Filimonas lacunae]SIS75459.1 23S rRNA (uracil1939-C5)-methyltransferase [Filimonas lacunae]